MASRYREDFLEDIAGKMESARKDLAEALQRAEYIGSMAADGYDARLAEELYMAIDSARDGMETLTDATEDLLKMQKAPGAPGGECVAVMEVD